MVRTTGSGAAFPAARVAPGEERNFRARAFYARWGFAEVGEMTFILGSDTQRDLVLALPCRLPIIPGGWTTPTRTP